MAAFWIIKAEPSDYAWEQMAADGRAAWDGVRNFQARNNLKAMRLGDRCFFYRSAKDLALVGVVEVAREFYPDPADETGRWGLVDVAAVAALPRPVRLKEIKGEPRLADLPLLRQSRLSVSPVGPAEWALLSRMAGLEA